MIDNHKSGKEIQSLVRFYDPYYRLNLRVRVQDTLACNPELQTITQGMDVTAIIDAVMKRGGCDSALSRIQQIQLSMPYYHPNILYQSCQRLKRIYSQLLNNLPIIQPQLPQHLIEQHLLPFEHPHEKYNLSQNEFIFATQNFSNLDEYFTIKTLAYFGTDLQKINQRYVYRYFILRKWLYIHDVVINVLDSQLIMIKNIDSIKPAKICIIGLTLSNIIMGIKLVNFGHKVKIFDSCEQRIKKWVEGQIPDILKQGIFFTSQLKKPALNNILKTYFNLWIQKIQKEYIQKQQQNDQYNNKRQKTKILYKYKKIFITLLDDVLNGQINNNNKLAEDQFNLRAMNFICNLQNKWKNHQIHYQKIDLDLLQIYFQKFIMINKVKKGLNATVNDLANSIKSSFICSNILNATNNHQNKLKILLNSSEISTILYKKQNTFQFQQLLKQNKDNFKIMLQNIFIAAQHYENSQNDIQKWKVYSKNNQNNSEQIQQFDYLIYNDEKNIQQMIKTHNYSLPQIKKSADPINVPIIQQLILHAQIHNIYRFRQKITFKQVLKSKYQNTSIYSYQICNFGIVHFYLLPSGTDVLATICRSPLNQNIQLRKEIQNILIKQVLKHKCKLQIDASILQETELIFHIKDQRLLENFIKIQNHQNFYISLPLIHEETAKNHIESQLKINNKIIQQIMKKQTKKQQPSQRMKRVQKLMNEYYQNLNILLNKDSQHSINNINNYVEQNKSDTNKEMSEYHKKTTKNVGQVKNNNMKNIPPVQTIQQQNGHKLINMGNINVNRYSTELVDFFGLRSPLVVQYWRSSTNQIKHILQTLQKYSLTSDATDKILFYNEVQLTTLICLNCNSTSQFKVYLFKFGIPLIFQCMQTTPNENIFLQNYMTIRQDYSLLYCQTWSKFYQFCFVINSQLFYCIAEQINEKPLLQESIQGNKINNNRSALILYHINFITFTNTLSTLYNTIIKSGSGSWKSKNILYQTISRSYLYAIPTFIKDIIRKQVNNYKQLHPLQNNTQNICNIILNTKIKAIEEHHYNYQSNITTKTSNFQSLLMTLSPINISTLVFCVFQDVQNYIIFLTTLYKLKPYLLEDLMMGKLNSFYLLKQLQGFFNRPQPNLQINQQDLKFEQENEDIQSQYSQKALIHTILKQLSKTNKYTLKIQKQQNNKYNFERKFIQIKQNYQEQFNFHLLTLDLYNINNQPSSPTSDTNKWVTNIISKSIFNCRSKLDVVCKEFRSLIRQEFDTVVKIINFHNSEIPVQRNLYTYFLLTRMNYDFATKHQSIHIQTMQHLRQLTEQNKNKIQQLPDINTWKIKAEEMVNQCNIAISNNQEYIVSIK